jgi:hypothetical protein
MELGILYSLEAWGLRLLTVMLRRSFIWITGLGASLDARIVSVLRVEK